MTSHERFAIGSLLVSALVGHGIRLFAIDPSQAAGEFSLLSTVSAPPLAEQRARVAKLARPLGRTDRIDLNRADAEDIARLPKIGMPLAKKIVKHRTAHGGLPRWPSSMPCRGSGPACWLGSSRISPWATPIGFNGPEPPNPHQRRHRL